jgi:hypothetical protein
MALRNHQTQPTRESRRIDVQLSDLNLSFSLDRYGLPIPRKAGLHVRKFHANFIPHRVAEQFFFRVSHKTNLYFQLLIVLDDKFIGSRKGRLRGPDLEWLLQDAYAHLHEFGITDLKLYDINGYEVNMCVFNNYYHHPNKVVMKIFHLPFIVIAHTYPVRNFICFQLTIQEGQDSVFQVQCENYAARTLQSLLDLVAVKQHLSLEDFHVCCIKVLRPNSFVFIDHESFHTTFMDKPPLASRIIFQAKSIPFEDGILRKLAIPLEKVLELRHHQPSQGTEA